MTSTEFLKQEEQALKRKYLNGPAYLSIIHESTRLLKGAQESGKEEDWQAFTKYRQASFKSVVALGFGEELINFLEDYSAIIDTIQAKAGEWDEE